MRIASGVTDQVIYFVAVDSTDLKTRETGLATFTVYRSRNGGAATAYTTPTVTEVSGANMPGVYKLLLDEDMTIDSGDETQEICLHITQADMAPVTRVIELYRPKITVGNTLGVAADGDISGNLDGTVATLTTYTGNTPQTGDAYARLGAPAGASVSADVAAVKSDTAATLIDTAEIGVAGAGLTNINLPDQTMNITGNITGNLSGSVGSVTGNVAGSVGSVTGGINTGAGIITTLDGLDTAQDTQHAQTQSDIAGLNDPTAAAIADAVWDEVQSGHVGIGTFGEVATEIASILTDTAEIGTAGAGLTNINLPDQTMNITGNITGNLSGSVGSVTGAVGSVTGAVGSVASGGITAASIATGAIDADALATDAVDEIVDAVWDELLTGATHNVATSAGRRLRTIQDNQSYDGGAIWIDTVNGTAGTTIYENGTSGLPVSTLADALTLAVAANLKHLHFVNGSSVTLASTLDSYELSGDEWGIALGGQSVDGLSIHNAHKVGVGVTGTFSGNPHILHSTIGTAGITGPNARMGWCALLGPVTSNGTGTWVIHSCWGLSGAKFDFGAGAATTVYITDWLGGPIQIDNMATGDVLYLEGKASGSVTLDASCTGGTVYIAGDIPLTNNGSGQTINQTSRYEITRILSDSTAFQGADISAILVDTDATIPAQITALNDLTGTEVGDAVLDEVVEGSWTLRQILRLYSSVLLGKIADAETTTNTFRDIDDSKARVTATVDRDGNRSAITLDAS